MLISFAANPTNTTPSFPQTFDYSAFNPFSSEKYFHEECFITDYTDQLSVEQCWLGDGKLPLADLNTENPEVVVTLNTWISRLVSNYSIDGIRIDTAKHVRKDFWPDFVKAAGVFTMGEVYSENVTYVKEYTGEFSYSPCLSF